MAELAEKVSPLTEPVRATPRAVPKPSARQWLIHIGLFLITAFSTTLCGILMNAPGVDVSNVPRPVSGIAGTLLAIPWLYAGTVVAILHYAFVHPYFLVQGLIFSGSLLAILAAHESGHYLFCRYYGVDATLPFFIPQPPLLIPGTFGAFIRMKSPVPSRRALFDIGLAGPLAGFVLIVPIAFAGVMTLHHVPLIAGNGGDGGGGIIFNDPLLFRLIARWFRIDLDNSAANSFYLAAWVGALVTSLNLMPVGQLDGGHGTFSIFGKIAHRWIGCAAFVAMAMISVLGWMWHGSPSGFVYVLLLAVMLRVRHPQPEQMEPLGAARIVVGILTLLVFILCFLPFPITIT
jgi:membrane-associated protease RseP (regulator of RpoE activity)